MNFKLVTAGVMGVLLAACGGGGKEKGEATPDTTPDFLVLKSIEGLDLSERHSTGSYTISGIDQSVAINVTGCAYSLNGADYSVESSQVQVGDILSFQVEAPEEYGEEVVCSISIGGYQSSFSVATKTVAARATFFYNPLTFSSSIVERPADLVALFIHSKENSDYIEVDTFDNNSAFFIGSVPDAYTALFVTEVAGEHLVILHTSHSPTENEEVILPETNPFRGSNDDTVENCKELEFDRSRLSSSLDGYWFYLNSPDICNGWREWSRGDTISTQVSPNTGVVDNLLLSVADETDNYIGYKFISSDDHDNGSTYYLEGLDTDFSQIEVSNPYNQDTGFYARASSGENLERVYEIGELQLDGTMSTGLMNVINLDADSYMLGYYGGELSSQREAYQGYWGSSRGDSLSNLNLNSFEYSHVSSLTLSIGYEIHIEWLGINLEDFDTAHVVFDSISDDINMMWQITAPNEGSITVPHFSNTVLSNFSFEYEGLQLRLRKDSEDGNSYSTVLVDTLFYCDTDDCQKTINLD